MPFKEIKRIVAIVKLRKCELIKFSKLPYEVATLFCRQGSRGQAGKKLNSPLVSHQHMAGWCQQGALLVITAGEAPRGP